ncbi:hypothetical protein [Helicobacter sp. MIT 14-3879]|uniref:hypothetical protein n=1 Tax=Helicobacter sp. MIT 14-3879 TaxID=2040649 RepID=UPI0015F1926F|nr:hypothetical protein [Helicobacter sp. MIT 14-3879]
MQKEYQLKEITIPIMFCFDKNYAIPLGKVVYFMPPYIISKEQVSFVIEGLKNILKSLC